MQNANRKFLIIVIAAVLIVVVSTILAVTRQPPQTQVRKVDVEKPSAQNAVADIPKPSFAPDVDYSELEEQDLQVKPSVVQYTVKSDLSNIANIKIFKNILEPKQRAMIAKNYFVVSPTDYIQMFQVYENNEYQRPEKIPAFITTDAMLHTYHIFYDYSLRQVESDKLYTIAVKLTDAMLAASEKDYADAKDTFVKDAARRNVAYFAVARNLLKGTPPPKSVADLVDADLKKIADHERRDISSVFGHKVDFTQFVPRGHYTRSEKLKRYFRGMMWYGLTQFAIPQGDIGPRPTLQAVLVVRNLRTVTTGDKSAMSLWDTIYEPTAFYVGTADDYTVYQYSALMDRVYGKNPSLSSFADKARLQTFIKEVEKLPAPGIENFVAGPDGFSDRLFPTGRQFRFMGQRFIPDSRIMQELTHPKVDGRNFPKGLDVLAAMGSDRALQILDETYRVNEFFGYESQMSKMRKEMTDLPLSKWQSNLYYGWLWSLQSIVEPVSDGYPSFMKTNTWLDKSMFTALGSWTELRHDTILYAKQSVAECGGAGEEIPTPKGYVEPNLAFWTKLKWLNEYTEAGLNSRGLLNQEMKDKFSSLGDWIDFCRNITIKELTNKKVTEEEYQHIQYFGAELEGLLISFAGGDIISDTDKDMAVVADVHTSFDKVMEEGVGRVGAIYVVVPIEGKLYLTRGATFTQYEFEYPAADRLTDEKWQDMLKSGQEPGLAEWVNSFFLQTKKKPAPEFENYLGGC